MRLKKPLLFNCPPRHLHVVTLLRTKCVVDDRALAGISEIHEPRRMKDGWWKSPTLRDGVSLKTPGGRQRETTSLISQVTDDGTNKDCAETWTMRQVDIARLEAFEMWIWRRMERISWTEHISNEEVLTLVGEERSLISTIRARQRNWMGHLLRGDSLQR